MFNTQESLSEKFVKKGFWIYFFSFLIGPIGYAIRILFSSTLTVEEVGVIYGVISLVTILTSYNDFGISESLNYFLPRFVVEKNWKKVKSLLAFSYTVQFITGSILFFLIFFGADWLAIHYFSTPIAKQVLEAFAVYLLFTCAYTSTTVTFSALQNTKYQRWVEFFRTVFLFGYAIVAHLLGHGVLMVYSWGWTIALFFGVIFSLVLFYRDYYKPYLANVALEWDWSLCREVFKYALWVVLATNIGTILGQVDMQMLLLMKWAAEAGYYSNYLSLINIPFIFLAPIFSLLYPVISEMHASNQSEKITQIKHFFQKYFSVLAIFTGVMLFVFGPMLAYILFGKAFIYSGEILQFSAFFLVFNFLLQINFNILGGTGAIRRRAFILGVGLPVNMLLNFFLIQQLGARGSSLAVGLSWILLFWLSQKETHKYETSFEPFFLIKNIVGLAALWWVLYTWIVPLGNQLERLNSLLFLLIVGVFSIWWLAILNMGDIKPIVSEIKTIFKNRKGKALPETPAQTVNELS